MSTNRRHTHTRRRTGPSDFDRLAERVRALEKAPDCPFARESFSSLIEEIAERQERILEHFEQRQKRTTEADHNRWHEQIFGPGGSIERVRAEAREAALKEQYGDLLLMAGQEGYLQGYYAGSGAAKEAKERNEPVPPPPEPPKLAVPGRLRRE